MSFSAYFFGRFNVHRSAAPVLIGSPLVAFVGRHFMRLAGLLSSVVGLGFLSCAQRSAGASRLLAWAGAPCYHAAALAQRLSLLRLALRRLAVSRGLRLASFLASPWAAIIHSVKTVLPFSQRANPAVDPAPFSRWTLRDKAAQRRSPLR
jgi:hypothetical protein